MTQWGLDVLFNPAKRHMDEEKRRLQSTREEVGDASGGRRIDLDSGKVTIQRDEGDADRGDEDGGTGEELDASTPAGSAKTAKTAKTAEGEKDLTPAQLRALKRRGKA